MHYAIPQEAHYAVPLSLRTTTHGLQDKENHLYRIPQRKEDSQCMKMTAAYSLPEMPTD